MKFTIGVVIGTVFGPMVKSYIKTRRARCGSFSE